MTARKNWRPKDAKRSADNQWFEALAIAEIEKHPTSEWENMRALWLYLPSCRVSTRSRILARMIEVAAKRGNPLSAKFVRRFANVYATLAVSPKARDRIHDAKGLREAARLLAQNPKASLTALAKAAGSKKSTIRNWKKSDEFTRLLGDEQLKRDLHADEPKLWKTETDEDGIRIRSVPR